MTRKITRFFAVAVCGVTALFALLLLVACSTVDLPDTYQVGRVLVEYPNNFSPSKDEPSEGLEKTSSGATYQLIDGRLQCSDTETAAIAVREYTDASFDEALGRAESLSTAEPLDQETLEAVNAKWGSNVGQGSQMKYAEPKTVTVNGAEGFVQEASAEAEDSSPAARLVAQHVRIDDESFAKISFLGSEEDYNAHEAEINAIFASLTVAE